MRTLGLLLALACAPLAVAQEDLASRQLQNGDRLARDGKMEQALAAWRDVYERYPDSASAPMALDRLGAAAYPVERFELRGTVAGEAIARGRGYYEKIATDYRTSPLAARAAFKLGLMFSDPAARFFNLDEAYARFSTLISLYPGSQHVDGALYGLGEILARQGELDRSLIPLERVLAEHPAGEMAAEAAFLQASCLARLGARDAALRAFQIIRDQYPASRRAGLQGPDHAPDSTDVREGGDGPLQPQRSHQARPAHRPAHSQRGRPGRGRGRPHRRGRPPR